MEDQPGNRIDESRKIRLTLADVLRAADVNRWQIVRMTRHQSVAEHTFNVMLVALDIAEAMGFKDRYAIMQCAMMHDIPEVLTGDIATPTKRVLEVSDRLDAIEGRVEYLGIKTKDYDPMVRHIVKLADLVESAVFLHHFGVGKHAEHVLDQLNKRIECFDEAKEVFEKALNAVPTTIDGAA